MYPELASAVIYDRKSAISNMGTLNIKKIVWLIRLTLSPLPMKLVLKLDVVFIVRKCCALVILKNLNIPYKLNNGTETQFGRECTFNLSITVITTN